MQDDRKPERYQRRRPEILAVAEKLGVFSAAQIAAELGHTGAVAHSTKMIVRHMARSGELVKERVGVFRHPSISPADPRVSDAEPARPGSRPKPRLPRPRTRREPDNEKILSTLETIMTQYLARHDVAPAELPVLITKVRRSISGLES